jgi:diguanylate cyclase (GGDEF)-like protein
MNTGPVFGGARTPLRARPWILAFGVILLLAISLSAVFSVLPLISGRSELSQVARDGQARHQVGELRTTLADWQLFVEQRLVLLSPTGTKLADADLTTGVLLITAEQSQTKDLANTLRAVGLSSIAGSLESTSGEFQKAVADLTPLLSGVSRAVITAVVTAVRNVFTRMWIVTQTAVDRLTQLAAVDLQQGTRHLDTGRMTVLILDGAFGLIAAIGAFVLGQRARRRQVAERRTAERRAFEGVLQQAMEMSGAEADVYDILRDALSTAVPRLQAEMLVADSSHAHFHRTFTTATDSDERSGCGVVSPQDCPATIRSHTLVFRSSGALDACPHLKHRPSGECSAVCVPVSVAGKTVGVTHATGADHEPPTEIEIRYLQISSRRASERLAMVRAFDKSETQAHTDPLTGLLNRRSIENRVRELQREGVPYILAYGDLDHFKVLNDTHGHEAGDQALRMFSRVMRDSVRPNDLVSRYGGEEFVIVLPDCNTEVAVAVLERVRERLALALASGPLPPFTVSFGITSSTQHKSFEEILAAADRALIAAKSAGRNRVILADQTLVGAPIPNVPNA